MEVMNELFVPIFDHQEKFFFFFADKFQKFLVEINEQRNVALINNLYHIKKKHLMIFYICRLALIQFVVKWKLR